MTYHFDIDPEGFVRYGGACICGPVYTYAGHPEPGGFDPDCPDHGEKAHFMSATLLRSFPFCPPGHTHDALCDPALEVPRVEPRRPDEIAREGTEEFLDRWQQEAWREQQFARALLPLPPRNPKGQFQGKGKKKGGRR